MALMAMADGSTNMAIRSIQSKCIEKLTQLCWLQLIWTFQSKVMAIWTLVVGAYIVSYNVKMFDLSKSYPHGFRCSNHINPNMFSSGNGPKWKNPTRYSWFDSPWTILSLSSAQCPSHLGAGELPEGAALLHHPAAHAALLRHVPPVQPPNHLRWGNILAWRN